MKNSAEEIADVVSTVVLLLGLCMCCLLILIRQAALPGETDEAISETCGYEERIDEILEAQSFDADEYETCVRYNDALFRDENGESLTETDLELLASYSERISDREIAYVAIPVPPFIVPVMRGTGSKTLLEGAGHIVSSSLPVGGVNAHCVIAGHSGRLGENGFENIDRMSVGDRFYVLCMGMKMAYRVVDIMEVEPSNRSALDIREGGDLVTLVTCTPTGVNSHRLLICGARIR